jgi:hypothetical protein
MYKDEFLQMKGRQNLFFSMRHLLHVGKITVKYLILK